MIIVNYMSIFRTGRQQSQQTKDQITTTVYNYPAVNAVYCSKEVGQTLYSYYNANGGPVSGALFGKIVKMPNATLITEVTSVLNGTNPVGQWFVADTTAGAKSIEEQAKEALVSANMISHSDDIRVIAVYLDANKNVALTAFGATGEMGISFKEDYIAPINIGGASKTELTRMEFKQFARGLRAGTIQHPAGGRFVPDKSYSELARRDPYSPRNLAWKGAPVAIATGAAIEVALVDGKGIAKWGVHRAGPWLSENAHKVVVALGNTPITTAVAIGTVVATGTLLLSHYILRRGSSYDKELAPTGTGTA